MNRYAPELCAGLRTGDLVLFSGKGVGSAGIKWASTSRWSHVALVLTLPEHPGVMIWESTTLTDLADRDTATAHAGVQLVDLLQRAERYDGDIAIRRLLDVELAAEDIDRLRALRRELVGRDYESDQIELIRAAWDGPFGHNREDLSALFCSELVAESYQRLGLLGPRKPSNEYVPADFAQKRRLRMLRGRLGDEVLIKEVEGD